MVDNGLIKLKIISPEKVILEKSVGSVTVPAISGPLHVLPRRAPYISSLDVGVAVVNADGARKVFFVEGGVVEIKNDTCVVLTNSALQLDPKTRPTIAHGLLSYKKDLKLAKTMVARDMINTRIRYAEMLLNAIDGM